MGKLPDSLSDERLAVLADKAGGHYIGAPATREETRAMAIELQTFRRAHAPTAHDDKANVNVLASLSLNVALGAEDRAKVMALLKEAAQLRQENAALHGAPPSVCIGPKLADGSCDHSFDLAYVCEHCHKVDFDRAAAEALDAREEYPE